MDAEPGRKLFVKTLASIVATFAVALVVLMGSVDLIDGGGPFWLTGHHLTADKWYEAVRDTAAFMALTVAGGAAYLTYRRQRTADLNQNTAARAQQTAVDADLRARFSKAAEHLAHESAAVRLAGVYAMSAVADDWAVMAGEGEVGEVQVCVNVLCGYLRLPFEAVIGADYYDRFDCSQHERVVRKAIVRVLAEHLIEESEPSWSTCELDFRGAWLEDVDFESAHFKGRKTRFSDVKFEGDRTRFDEAVFGSSKTNFDGATFNNVRTNFDRAKFNSDTTKFDRATFNSDTTRFDGAEFNGRSISFDKPRAWKNVKFDWDKDPVTMPSTVTPRVWPPTVVPDFYQTSARLRRGFWRGLQRGRRVGVRRR